MNILQSIRFPNAISCLGLAVVMFLPICVVAQQREMGREEVIAALERGVAALKTIDRPDQAEQLLNTLKEYRRLDRERQRATADAKRESPEREIGMQQVRQMLVAFEALKNAEKNEAAELLEHAIHARKLRLERAEGPDAREIIESAPSRENEIELLFMAADLLQESGKPDKAEVVRRLGEQFRETINRNRQRRKSNDAKQPKDANKRNVNPQPNDARMLSDAWKRNSVNDKHGRRKSKSPSSAWLRKPNGIRRRSLNCPSNSGGSRSLANDYSCSWNVCWIAIEYSFYYLDTLTMWRRPYVFRRFPKSSAVWALATVLS